MTNRTKTIIVAFILLASLVMLGFNIHSYYNNDSIAIWRIISNIAVVVICGLYFLVDKSKKEE